MTNHLTRESLYTLEKYATVRADFRSKVLAEKKNREVTLGDHVLLLFENRLTIQYQIQEMLRIEKIFEPAGIEEELESYNPLIPDGDNLKATMMIQYEDVEERRRQLNILVGIENLIWVRVGQGEKVFAIADEDLQRADENKTSAVHFLRFQLTQKQVEEARNGAHVSIGVDHASYTASINPLDTATQSALVDDLS